MHMEVARVNYDKLSDVKLGEPTEAIRRRVQAARDRQGARFAGNPTHVQTPTWARPRCASIVSWTRPAVGWMKAAMQQLNLSARGYHRILKLSRTLADIAGAERIATAHLAEALQYRPRRGEG